MPPNESLCMKLSHVELIMQFFCAIGGFKTDYYVNENGFYHDDHTEESDSDEMTASWQKLVEKGC